MGFPSIKCTCFLQDGDSLKGKYWGGLGLGAKVKHRTALGRKGVVLITSPPPSCQTHQAPGVEALRSPASYITAPASVCIGVANEQPLPLILQQPVSLGFVFLLLLPVTQNMASAQFQGTVRPPDLNKLQQCSLSRVGVDMDSIPATS